MSGTIPPLPLHAFMECTGTTSCSSIRSDRQDYSMSLFHCISSAKEPNAYTRLSICHLVFVTTQTTFAKTRRRLLNSKHKITQKPWLLPARATRLASGSTSARPQHLRPTSLSADSHKNSALLRLLCREVAKQGTKNLTCATFLPNVRHGHNVASNSAVQTTGHKISLLIRHPLPERSLDVAKCEIAHCS